MYWAPFLTRDFRPWNLVPGGQLFWLIFIGFTGWRAQAQWNLEYVAGENRAAQVVSALWSMHWRVILTVRILEMFSHDQQSRHIPSTGGSHHQSVNRRKEKKSIKQTYHGTPTWIARHLSGEGLPDLSTWNAWQPLNWSPNAKTKAGHRRTSSSHQSC